MPKRPLVGFSPSDESVTDLRFPLLLAVEASAILALRLVYDTSAIAVRAARIYRPCLGAATTPCDDDSGAHFGWRGILLRGKKRKKKKNSRSCCEKVS